MPAAPRQPGQIRRTRIALNVVAQVMITAAILIMINYLGFTRFKRWDLSRTNRFTLSEQTRKLLSSLKKETRILVVFSPTASSSGSELFYDVDNLLKEYQYAGKRKIRVESVDPYRNLTQARRLQEKYKFGPNDSVIVISYGDRTRIVPARELAEYGASGMFDRSPEVRAFKGEQVITSALLTLVDERKPKVGFVSGHDELALDASLSRLATYAGAQALDVSTLSLPGAAGVPSDFAAVVLAGPKYDLSEAEVQMLRQYLGRQGRLWVLLRPKAQLPHLDGFLAEFGLKSDRDLIITKVNTGIAEQSVTLDVYGRFLTEAPFVRPLGQTTAYFPGGTTSLRLDPAPLAPGNLRAYKILTPLIETYWGEKDDFLATNANPTFTPGVDLLPPLIFGWAFEKGASLDPRLQVRSSMRLIVLGNVDFLLNESLSQALPDVDFALLCLNWLTERSSLLAIAPRIPQTYVLNLPPGATTRILFLVVGVIPLLAGFSGIAVWLTRRA